MPKKNSASKYKYVYLVKNNNWNTIKSRMDLIWNAHPMTYEFGKVKSLGSKTFKTEREAALHVDKVFIRYGLPPVNILKPVSK
jgi:hypothetical protein